MRHIFVLDRELQQEKKNSQCTVNKLVILFYVVSNKDSTEEKNELGGRYNVMQRKGGLKFTIRQCEFS